jgi:signal peptidase II
MRRMPGARWLWLSLALLVLDRATKFVIERYTTTSFHRPLLSDFVVLVHNQNQGIAFGLFSGASSGWLAPVLLAGSIAVMALLAWFLLSGRADGKLAQCGIALILGGAAGNVLDRILHGSVTDFIEVGLGSYRWPAFNVADSAITVGAALVIIEMLLVAPRQSESGKKQRG